MTVIDKISINKQVEGLYNFLSQNKEFEKDYKTAFFSQNSKMAVSHLLFSSNKIIESYLKSADHLSDLEVSQIKNFKNNIFGIFEIKKILKDEFELFNLLNEQTYFVKPAKKLHEYRNYSTKQFLAARLVLIEKTYYLLEILGYFPSTKSSDAYRYAVSLQIQSPELLYKDNSQKLIELENFVKESSIKFQEFFKKDEIITTSNKIDALISCFNDYLDENSQIEEDDIKKLIKKPKDYKYFKLKKQNNNFFESLTQGYSLNNQVYDIGLINDNELGLFVIPFYGTFKKIFNTENYQNIKNYQDCIRYFFENSQIPPSIILKIYDKNKSKFIKIIQKTLTTEKNIEELLQKNKPEFYKNKKFSSATVLYNSKTFDNFTKFINEPIKKSFENIGRNELCPCASGKKYKKCCGN
ncbi:MAG: SEC-C domain-containing protein [Candidatus Gastranaerophilales bacterium]|nr:SEC-C domain-containing protein [Candidatus Gastranaerophilales bacterium]